MATTPPQTGKQHTDDNSMHRKSPSEIENQLTQELTSNPYKQYRFPQEITPSTPYTNPIDEYRSSPNITGIQGSGSAHAPRDSIFSAYVARDDIDSIPTSALFIGRIGQTKPKQLVKFIQETPTQREFFEQAGYDDEMLKYTILPAAAVAGTFGLLSTPFERARALVQADAASIAALQDYNEKNMVGKLNTPSQNKIVENLVTANQNDDIDKGLKEFQLDEKNKSTQMASNDVENKASKPTTKAPQKISQKKLLSSMIQPERRDTFSNFFKNNPNSTKAPILRPNSYDIYARRQVLLFEEEYTRVLAMPEFRTLSGYEKALKAKELNPTLKNIHVSPYDIFNHHIEHGMAQRSTVLEPALDMMNGGVSNTSTESRTKIKPMEGDVFPQNQSDTYRGFHRYYAEERYTTIRSALRAMINHNGMRSLFQLSLLPTLGKIVPFVFFASFYQPWKLWMTEIVGKEPVFTAEAVLSEVHCRYQIFTLLAVYPLYALLSSIHANKTALYPNYSIKTSPELQHWKERFTSFHLLNQTFSRYTTKTPQANAASQSIVSALNLGGKNNPDTPPIIEKYHETSEHSPINREYKAKQHSFIDSLINRELKKSRTKIILEQMVAVNGPKSFLRGFRPAFFASILYYITYIITFTFTGTAVVEGLHEFRSKMKPPPPQGHQHDINIEIIKAMVPFSCATLAAQYMAYPLTTIRQYIMAADSPGYVTFNKNANVLPHGIAVDQYRLPFRQVEPVKPRHQIRVAMHEIKRQYGLRGFYHGASIIPLVRLPQSLLIGSTLFYCLHKQWPAMNQIIDSQHFYDTLPTLL